MGGPVGAFELEEHDEETEEDGSEHLNKSQLEVPPKDPIVLHQQKFEMHEELAEALAVDKILSASTNQRPIRGL